MIKQPPTGLHLIVDIRSDTNLTDAEGIRACLERVAAACGATVLGSSLHHFGAGAGVTGVVLLAESHISIHTWPEHSFAAVDIFMCGSCDPYQAMPVLSDFFATDKIHVRALERRVVET